ncbi:MAG: hypothetical protein Q7S58_06400 [Candidatus Binatus sp.]|nr:hypothetical protein [Candidatus Binatus sp.]
MRALGDSVRTRRFAIVVGFLCATLGGCSRAAVANLPADAGPANAALNAGGAALLSRNGVVVPKEELQEHCNQLARTTPGIEELRMENDGTIESRQWVLVAHDSAPRWAVVSAKNDPSRGWAPKPGIAQLDFRPQLRPALTKGASQFLAYAPIQSDNYDESLKIATVTEVFGGPQGKFQWRGRTYGYTLTPELVCFPRLE